MGAMSFHWTLLLTVGGLLMVALEVGILVRRARFEQRAVAARGTVTEVSVTSSGEFPVIRFSPAGAVGEVTLGKFPAPTGDYRLGDRVPVSYDPRDPDNARLDTDHAKAMRKMTDRALLGCGAMLVVLGLGLFSFIPGIEVDEAARDVAIEDFLRAVRRDDMKAVRKAAARGARLDEAFLQTHVRPSTGFKQNSSDIGFDATSCVRGGVPPSRHQLVLKLVKHEGRWKVLRAANRDKDCEERLD
jgi:hypothetical protein